LSPSTDKLYSGRRTVNNQEDRPLAGAFSTIRGTHYRVRGGLQPSAPFHIF
jgi:hypothetical protein